MITKKNCCVNINSSNCIHYLTTNTITRNLWFIHSSIVKLAELGTAWMGSPDISLDSWFPIWGPHHTPCTSDKRIIHDKKDRISFQMRWIAVGVFKMAFFDILTVKMRRRVEMIIRLCHFSTLLYDIWYSVVTQ